MIENGRNNESTIQDSRNDNGVLELGKLVAESAVRSVPEEPFAFWEEVLRISASAAALGEFNSELLGFG